MNMNKLYPFPTEYFVDDEMLLSKCNVDVSCTLTVV